MELVLYCLLPIAGLALINVSYYHVYLSYASRGWPSVTGHVVKTKIKEVTNENGVKHWLLTIVYEYDVEGKSYRGFGLRIGERSKKFKQHDNLLDYALVFANEPIEVYFHPRFHRISTLKTSTSKTVTGRLILGVVLLIASILVLILIR